MAKMILNNALASGNEVEAIRDGWYVKRPDGRLEITQKALKAYEAAAAKVEKLAGLVRSGLEQGGAVEAGGLDAGIFVNERRVPAWREEFVKLGGDAKAVLAATPARAYNQLRIGDLSKVRGERIAPSADGSPVGGSGSDNEVKEAA
jgi:hypothetical protein